MRVTLKIELRDDAPARDAALLADALREWAEEWQEEVFEFERYEVRDSNVQYVGDSILPRRSPNGIWWALRGRMRFARDGRRVNFAFSRTLASRGVFFAVPPRIKGRR